jgi:hypothetical protein
MLGPGQHKDVSVAFDRLYESAKPIDDRAIQTATELWLKQRKGETAADRNDPVANLFHIFTVAPSVFEGVGVIATNVTNTIEAAVRTVENSSGEDAEALVAAVRSGTLNAYTAGAKDRYQRGPQTSLTSIGRRQTNIM